MKNFNIGRNEPCYCGSGKKLKNCCKDNGKQFNQTENEYDCLVQKFALHKIPFDQMEFYNHPNFIAQEKRDPKYLEEYARFVRDQYYSEEYLKRARERIPHICSILDNELTKDGVTGACISTSMVLSKILEQEGFWNYCVKGALTIEFPSSSMISPTFYWPIDTGRFDAGHAWVVAPPFTVIDLTVKQQPYQKGERLFLPEYVITEKQDSADVLVEDIYSTEAIRMMHIRKESKLDNINPNLYQFIGNFPPRQVLFEKTTLKYTTVAISMSDAGSLKDITTLNLNGRSGYQIYTDIIKPSLL